MCVYVYPIKSSSTLTSYLFLLMILAYQQMTMRLKDCNKKDAQKMWSSTPGALIFRTRTHQSFSQEGKERKERCTSQPKKVRDLSHVLLLHFKHYHRLSSLFLPCLLLLFHLSKLVVSLLRYLSPASASASATAASAGVKRVSNQGATPTSVYI